MLTTVILILREFLEAAILISLLMVFHLKFHFYRHWLVISLLAGTIGAWLYAEAFTAISSWFDGSGQEVVNGFSLLCIGICLALLLLLSVWRYRNPVPVTTRLFTFTLTASATVIMVMAISREGSEIMVYYSGIAEHQRNGASMIIGGIIGGGLGLCIGVLSFTLLYQLAMRDLMMVNSLLLILITAGVMAEATQFFIQAGWIITAEPLWDTSALIAESSVTGQLLYAIFAYEASPTREEVTVWCLTAILLTATLLVLYGKKYRAA